MNGREFQERLDAKTTLIYANKVNQKNYEML